MNKIISTSCGGLQLTCIAAHLKYATRGRQVRGLCLIRKALRSRTIPHVYTYSGRISGSKQFSSRCDHYFYCRNLYSVKLLNNIRFKIIKLLLLMPFICYAFLILYFQNLYPAAHLYCKSFLCKSLH